MVAANLDRIERHRGTLTLDVRDKIGEQPLWDAANQRLIWCDNALGVIHEAKLDDSGG